MGFFSPPWPFSGEQEQPGPLEDWERIQAQGQLQHRVAFYTLTCKGPETHSSHSENTEAQAAELHQAFNRAGSGWALLALWNLTCQFFGQSLTISV